MAVGICEMTIDHMLNVDSITHQSFYQVPPGNGSLLSGTSINAALFHEIISSCKVVTIDKEVIAYTL